MLSVTFTAEFDSQNIVRFTAAMYEMSQQMFVSQCMTQSLFTTTRMPLYSLSMAVLIPFLPHPPSSNNNDHSSAKHFKHSRPLISP
ncbi:MAG: hypothetical protein FRX48_00425 [Lasallia pustulata]|uniref:Uncharacterized protein n=1 Tax=Lasallia pustulata TaxID=136370 RepID=A0A5M8Q2V9_9LECA|nr:MAG: hypothetical protein FRX48_00425 [Lasallia pustulata]